jgi:hypothetical protein
MEPEVSYKLRCELHGHQEDVSICSTCSVGTVPWPVCSSAIDARLGPMAGQGRLRGRLGRCHVISRQDHQDLGRGLPYKLLLGAHPGALLPLRKAVGRQQQQQQPAQFVVVQCQR